LVYWQAVLWEVTFYVGGWAVYKGILNAPKDGDVALRYLPSFADVSLWCVPDGRRSLIFPVGFCGSVRGIRMFRLLVKARREPQGCTTFAIVYNSVWCQYDGLLLGTSGLSWE
jgi:hypothetical protein